jgi:tRNA pseudouridine55 synthase
VYVEPFVGAAMYTLEGIAALRGGGDWPAILPADLAVRHLAAVCLDPAATERLLHGQSVAAGALQASGRVRLYDDAARFLGIGEADGQGHVRPRRLFVL